MSTIPSRNKREGFYAGCINRLHVREHFYYSPCTSIISTRTTPANRKQAKHARMNPWTCPF